MPEPAAPALQARGVLGGDGSPVLLGVDFPLGIPAAYAAKAGLRSFRALLAGLGSEGAFGGLGEIATTLGEVSLARPFYPAGRVPPGAARRADHAAALGLPLAALWRTCDRVAGAEALFWTLGPRQVGKAALAGWRELLLPLVASPPTASSPEGWLGEVSASAGSGPRRRGERGDAHGNPAVGLWPFDGELDELLATRHLVVAEAWPSMGRRLLPSAPGSPRWSKRTVEGRRAQGGGIHQLAHAVGACPSDAASAAIADGFAQGGEDGFDAFVGLLGMLEVLAHGEALPPPPARPGPAVLDVEGWILGLGADGFARSGKGGE